MATELRHITRNEYTDALFRANGDHGQSNINTDADPEGRSDTWTYYNDDKSLLHYAANQFNWNGAAIAYAANDFGEVTLHDDLLVDEYIKRAGGTDDYVRFENDKISVVAGGVTAWTFEDDQSYTALDVDIDGSLTLESGTSINNIVAATAYTDTDNCIWTGANIIDYVTAAVSAENLWDRAGTVLSPHTAGDGIATSGAIQIDSSANGLELGAGQNSKMHFNGTDTIIEYDLLNAGTTDLRIQEDGTNRLVVLTGGYTGIDNAAPSRLLTVGGAHDSPIISLNRSTITWSADQKTAFGCVDGEAGNLALGHNTTGGHRFNSYSKDVASGYNALFSAYGENDLTTRASFSFRALKHNGSGGLTVHGDAAKIFEVLNNATPLMTILGNGNVGIGTSPVTKIHAYDVVDGVFVGLAIDNRKTYGVGTGTNETSRIIFSLSDVGNTNPLNRIMGHIEAGVLSEATSINGFLALGVRDNGAETEKIRITPTGVGVDNASPSRLFTVGGAHDDPTISLNRSTITWTANQKTAFGCVDGEAGSLALVSNTTGGLRLRAYSKGAGAGGYNALFSAYTENDLTIQASFLFRAYKHDGAGALGDHGAAAKIFEVRNGGDVLMALMGNANFGIGMVPTELLSVNTPTNILHVIDIPSVVDNDTVSGAHGYIEIKAGSTTLYIQLYDTPPS